MKLITFFILISCSTITFATIHFDNFYDMEERRITLGVQPQRFSIVVDDKGALTKPTFPSYTQLNPLNPDAVYSLKPYPHTQLLPKIGKWMLITRGLPQTSNTNHTSIQAIVPREDAETKQINTQDKIQHFVPAHWLSLTNGKGQFIIEPINYIFIVFAKNAYQAAARFTAIANKIKFNGTASENHTNGYHAFIGDIFFEQLRNKKGLYLTFSNGNFRFQNDHFRVFGAHPLRINQEQAFILTASVSEETGIKPALTHYSPTKLKRLAEKIKAEGHKQGYHANYGHRFVSFANARNNLAIAFIQNGYPTYYAALGNILNTLSESTEDHDGNVFITVMR